MFGITFESNNLAESQLIAYILTLQNEDSEEIVQKTENGKNTGIHVGFLFNR